MLVRDLHCTFAHYTDYKEFKSLLIERYGPVNKVVMYHARPCVGASTADVFQSMTKAFEARTKAAMIAGYEVKECAAKISHGGVMVGAGVDVMFGGDLRHDAESGRYSKIIVVAGDGDYLYIFQKIREIVENRPEIVLISANKSRNMKLIPYVDDQLELEDAEILNRIKFPSMSLFCCCVYTQRLVKL